MSELSLTELLTKCDFEENEAKVYLALLELGTAPASEIAEKSFLERSLVYHHLTNLIKKGYASELSNKKVRRFSACEPLRIVQNLKVLTDTIQFNLPILLALQNRGRNRSRVEVYEGKEAILKVFRSLEMGKSTRYISSIQRLKEYFPEEVEGWLERYKSGATIATSKNLLTDTETDRKWGSQAKKLGQQVRVLPKHVDLGMDYSIVDDTLAIMSYDPLFIVVIHSAPIAHSAVQLFELVWKYATTNKNN